MKTIELSLSENYVSNWGIWEAIREILQNAQDADKEGHAIDVKLSGDELRITTHGVELPVSTLVLGNTSKLDDASLIGKYGEGYKLALIVLLREGYHVKIRSGSSLWEPRFKFSDTYETEVLCIDIHDNHYSAGASLCTTFIISGLSFGDISELTDKSLLIRKSRGMSLGQVIDSTYGKILLDRDFSGKFYVEGLYIQDDVAFQYGYSFDSSVVQLDRDRSAINYYDLLRLTTDSLMHQNLDVSIVETALVSKKKDLHYLKDYYYSDIPDSFAEEYAKYFNDKHGINEDTFVGTEREVLLSGEDNTFVTNGIEAKIVNQGNGNSVKYYEVQQLVEDSDNTESAWRIYNDSKLKKMHDWIMFNSKRLTDKQINKFLDIIDSMRPDGYSSIKSDVQDNLYSEIKRSKPKFSRKTNL